MGQRANVRLIGAPVGVGGQRAAIGRDADDADDFPNGDNVRP